MPRGDKSSYTNKQKRQAEHIEEGYEHRGTDRKEAERRAWATVNKETGGGKKRGSGRGAARSNVSSKRGGRIGGSRGGKASASRPASARSRSAKKAAATRKRQATKRSGAQKRPGTRKVAGRNSFQATRTDSAPAGGVTSASRCASSNPTISALGRAPLNKKPCPSWQPSERR